MSSPSTPAVEEPPVLEPEVEAPPAPAPAPALPVAKRTAFEKNGQFVVPLPTSTGLSAPAGQLLKGPTDAEGKPTAAALLVGIKLDLEAEVHLTARVKGDLTVGLY